MSKNLHSQHLEIDIFHAVEYRWPHTTAPHIAWPRQYALWLIEEGTLQVQIGARQWLLESGNVFLAPMRQPRRLTSPQAGVHWWSLNFLPSWFSQIDPLQSLQQPLLLQNPPGFRELQHTMQLLARRWMAPWPHGALTPASGDAYHSLLPLHRAAFSPEQRIIIQGLAHAVFGWCLEALERNQIPAHLHQSIPDWLMRALTIIEENPQVSVHDLAQQVAFSPAQLRRLFHHWLGASPQEYLVERRMDSAHRLLENTNWTVAAIAQSLGFSSTPSFTRIFKKAYGAAPAELRRALRNRPVAG